MTVDETTYGSAYAYGGDFEVHPAGTAVEIGRLRAALEAQAARIAELEGLLRRIEPYMDGLICYASTMGEHEPNRIAHDLRAALHPEVKP